MGNSNKRTTTAEYINALDIAYFETYSMLRSEEYKAYKQGLQTELTSLTKIGVASTAVVERIEEIQE
ncbi:hypothetical protein LX64_02359 [Chitinophaga skermanii]|uniref:Uncharacterized protein n=1 Tax=Chitinophaga skermanii TaxID=331697 RepID=A0A327QMV3_9BACT|nr:hypothetical protein [Chitinophaga skermanii]RAJ05205.1 hypothetical protein LX64_02359 [Chitinophaga skermanii]